MVSFIPTATSATLIFEYLLMSTPYAKQYDAYAYLNKESRRLYVEEKYPDSS